MQNRTRRVMVTALALCAIVALGACKDGGGGGGGGDFSQRYINDDGGESSVDMGNAEVPKDFPVNEIPLPEEGNLQAVVTGKQPPNRFYSFTYGLAGQNGVAIGRDYRDRLEKAGFKIENYSSNRDSDSGFTTFNAIGRRWDLSVASGRGSRLERPALSLQVTTHGSLETEDELVDPVGDSLLDPSDPNSVTTSTTIPLNGG